MTLIETTTPTEDAAESLIRHILTTLQVPSVSWATKEGLVAAAVDTIRNERASLTGQLERREQANQELADSLAKHQAGNLWLSLQLASALQWIEWLTVELMQRCDERDAARYQVEEQMDWLAATEADLAATTRERDLLADQLAALGSAIDLQLDLEGELADAGAEDAGDLADQLEAAGIQVEQQLAEAAQALDLVEALR